MSCKIRIPHRPTFIVENAIDFNSESVQKSVSTLLDSTDAKKSDVKDDLNNEPIIKFDLSEINEPFFLEVSINHPRTSSFLAASSEDQKRLYDLILRKLILGLQPNFTLTNEARYFELSGDGAYHCHSLLTISPDVKNIPYYHPVTIVSDVAKIICNCMPEKTKQFFKPAFLFCHWNRYKASNCCVQYKPMSDIEEYTRWNEYIRKYAPKIKK